MASKNVDPALMREVETLVRGWLADAARQPVSPAARRLAEALKDPAGLSFTVAFVDGVVRPEDARVAASNLQGLAREIPGFLPAHLRFLIGLGATLSTLMPGLVMGLARRALRRMVGHLLLDATDRRLGKSIARIRQHGVHLNINLLGEAVLGAEEAHRRLEGTRQLLARSDVDYVSLKVSAAIPPHSPWAFEESATHIQEQLLPLFTFAATSPTPKFINLDMEEYRDLDMTIAVFTGLLSRPELRNLEAGIVLQAYLPDALSAMVHLQTWAAERRAAGGAAIKVRLVKGANLPMEQVEASLHDWPLATWSTKQESDTNYKRVLDYALHPERADNVRLGVAGHNLFDIAYAWILAGRREVRDRVEFEMLLGMAEGQAEAVRKTVGGLLLYVPVVHPTNFDVAISYLVRRLEEGASQANFMSAVFELHESEELYARERCRFLDSLHDLDDTIPAPNRTQNRQTDDPGGSVGAPGAFANAIDTDPALSGNRLWGRAITQRVACSEIGVDLVTKFTIDEAADLDAVMNSTVEAGAGWGALSGSERAAYLRRAAGVLEARRADLLEVMASECGKTLEQSDPEVSEAIDFANYYANRAEELDLVDGAVPVSPRLTVVTPPWNFPVAIPAGSVLSALAAGSPVIVKPATEARRCGSVMVQALWDAGIPRDVLQLAHIDEDELGTELVSDERVDRLILTGSFETAELFKRFRPDLPLIAETSGKNAIVVTPHADYDLAVKDLVASAFGHAGQKCSAASLGILVGSVSSSQRFRAQLIDAVTSLKVGFPDDPTAQMGPVIAAPHGKLLRALTELGPGERWLVEPRELDGSGRLWSPGVKAGVTPGSEFHLTEYFGPVLGLVEVEDLEEALAVQNQVEYGLTAGLHSLDRAEIKHWMSSVEAGNLYVNRSTVGAIVQRQPFGGWKRSTVGATTKAGGPNYLLSLCHWRDTLAAEAAPLAPVQLSLLTLARDLGVSDVDLLHLQRAFGSDELAWQNEFGVARDVSALMAEKNVFRYLPVPVTVRAHAGPVRTLLRVLGAGLRAGSDLTLSTAQDLEPTLIAKLGALGVRCVLEDDDAWVRRLQEDPPQRVRLIGGDPITFAQHSSSRLDIALYAQPSVEGGRVEMLPFLHEQAIAITAHRFGTPTPVVEDLFT